MSQQVAPTSWLAVMLASLAGFGLLLAPAEQTDRIRTSIRDGAFPGLQGVDAAYRYALMLKDRLEQTPDDQGSSVAILTERDKWEQRCLELQTVNARLAGELEQARSGHGSPFLAEPGTPLFVPELIDANVIGAEELQQVTQRVSFRRVIDAGTGKDVIPSDFVVSNVPDDRVTASPLIDQGDDSGLHTDQPVFSGRCVVGKVGQVGRWTSTIIPVTDREYRGQAQLIRSSPRGLVLGPEGVIAGDGNGRCLLNHIPSTEPVASGDEVYTSVRLTGLPVPMYYGRVVKAALPDGAPHWEIVVEPAETMGTARVVQVLRSVLNPARTASQSDRVGESR